MIKPKDLTCRHCVYSAPDQYALAMSCRLDKEEFQIEPTYWCGKGYWIINIALSDKGTRNQGYSKEDLFICHVTGKLVDPWEE